MTYPTYNRPTKRKDSPPDMVRLPTYNRVGGVAVSMPTDPRRAYGLPRVVDQSNADAAFVRGQSVGDATGDASADTTAAQLPTYNPPSIIEGASPKQMPTVDPAMLTRQRRATGTPGALPNPDPVSMTATDDPGAAPVYSPLQQSQIRLRNLVNQPLQNNALASGGMLAAEAVGQAAQSGSVGRTIGAGLGGFLGGLVNKKAYARQKQAGEIQKQQAIVGMETQADREQRDAEKETSDAGYRKAQTRLTNANADYIEQTKPVVALGDLNRKDAQATAQSLRQHQQSIIQNLGQLKGQKLDPNNPAHAAFLERVQQAGLFLDPIAFNNSANNLVPVDVVDPENPTQRRRQYFNKATGEVTDAGQSGYVQPVNSITGRTAAQDAGVTDRRAGQAETQRHNAVTETQGGQRIGQGEERIGIARSRPTAGGVSGGMDRRAAKLADNFQREKQLGYSDPSAIKRKQHTANAIAIGKTLAENYNYETGADEKGNLYIKPRLPQGQDGGQSGRQRSSQRVATQADVAEYARQTGVDAARAAEHFRASGYAIQ